MASDRSEHQKPFTIGEQIQALNRLFPDARWTVGRNELTGDGLFSPTPLSDVYRLIFYYKRIGTSRCNVKVILKGDNLRRIEAKDFPHNYGIDAERREVELCLNRWWEFNSRKLLAETVVPWAIEWLYYYEGWLVTGKWLGGGEHPGKSKGKAHSDERQA